MTENARSSALLTGGIVGKLTLSYAAFLKLHPLCARVALTDEAALPFPLWGAEAAEAVDQVLAGSSVSAGVPHAVVHIWGAGRE